MPITREDIQPFIAPGQITTQSYLPQDFSGYGNYPNTGGIPRSNSPGGIGKLGSFGINSIGSFAGMPGGGSLIDYLAGNEDALDPISMLTGGLFGGGPDKPSWQTYVKDGQVYWEDPSKRNPVPLSPVPGASVGPDKNYQKAASNVNAIYNLLPYFNSAVNQGIAPNALAQLQASQLTSGPYAELMTQLYNQYGPQLNAIGNEISQRNALAQANTDKAVIEGPGKDLVKSAYSLSQVYDKPYYDSRLKGADALSNLLSSIDLSGALSTNERDEVGKGLAREGQSRGTAFAPSNTEVVGNAMNYGNASFQRKTQAQDALTKAISAASSFLPAAKSGVDVFQVATGRSSMPNPGDSKFTGVNTNTSQGGSQGAALGNQMFSGINSLQGLQMNIDSQKKDWLDQMNQFTSGIGNIMGAAKGAAAFI
jgi:hypothetical protein